MPKPPDLMEHLLERLEKGIEGSDPEAHLTMPTYDEHDMDVIKTFVLFCQDVLRLNAPIAVEYGEEGITLRMQDNALIPIVHGGGAALDDSSGYAHISQPKQQGKGIEPSQSWGVTGNE